MRWINHPARFVYTRASIAGIHFAMDFLTQQNRRVAGRTVTHEAIHAGGKNVVVLGGGDTGSDCVGTSKPAWCP